MRKFLRQFSIIAIAFVMIGGFAVATPAPAYAQNPLQVGPGAQGISQEQQRVQAEKDKAAEKPQECSIFNPLTWGIECFYGMIGRIIWYTLVPALGWILGLIGQVTDFALNLQLGTEFFREPAIVAGWRIIRDMCNMVFIFVLIYAGIATILNLSSANLKKVITGVIISALFINFSLYITRAIIDVSNITTAWFVQGVKNVGGGEGVSDSVRNALQMEKLIGSNAKPMKDAPIGFDTYLTGLAVVALNAIAIYVFFSVGFLFVVRIVSFMFLLITSPLGFIGGLGIGQLDDLYGSWWKELRAQALMAPMFFLMLYITLYIIDQVQSLVFISRGANDAVTGNSFSAGNYLMFAIIIVMLLRCLSIAKEYSGKMGDQMAGALKGAIGLATGTLAMGTIGKAAGAVAGNARFQSWAARSGVVGEVAMKATMGTASSSFGAASSYKSLGISKLGIPGTSDAFKGADKGYAGMIKKEVEDRKKFAKDAFGKGVEGAINRQAYGEGLKGGLFTRVIKTNPLLRPKDTAGMIGNTMLVGGLNAIPGIEATNKLPGFKKYVGKTSDEKAGGDISKDADKEYKKTAGEAAKEIMDKIEKELDKNPDVRKKLAENEILEEKIKAETDTLAGTFKKDLEDANKGEVAALNELKRFNEMTSSIDGSRVGDDVFNKEFEAAKIAAKAAEDKKKEVLKNIEELTSPELENMRKQVEDNEKMITEKSKKLLDDEWTALGKKGVNLEKELSETKKDIERKNEKLAIEKKKLIDTSEQALKKAALRRMINSGKKQKDEENSDKIKKLLDEDGGGDKGGDKGGGDKGGGEGGKEKK